MMPFIKLYTINFWKSKSGPFFVFGFPAMMLLILGGIMPYKYIAGGIFLLPLITVGTLVNPTALTDFRTTKILKRIALTNITKAKLVQALFVFNIMVMGVATLAGLGYIALFNALEIGNMEQEGFSMAINWATISFTDWGIIIGLTISLAILTAAIGLTIGFKSKSPTSGQMNGMFVYFPITFLSGIFLDMTALKSSSTMNAISKALPTRWIIEPIVALFTGEELSSVSSQWFIWAGPMAAVAIAVALMTYTWKSIEWSD